MFKQNQRINIPRDSNLIKFLILFPTFYIQLVVYSETSLKRTPLLRKLS